MRRALLIACVALLPLVASACPCAPTAPLSCFEHCDRLAARHSAKVVDLIDASNIDGQFAALEDAHLLKQFVLFKKVHQRRYESPAHEAHRFAIFKENMAKAAELSIKNPSATFGMNKFSDLHPVEFKKQYLHFVPAVGDSALLRERAPVHHSHKRLQASVPTSYDWRTPDQGRPVGVTAVKDQGQCGSCWAFSATEELESAWILAGNPVAELAPQQTVDCDTVDQGCNGGDTVSAYTYMEGAGVEAEASYPYTSGISGAATTCNYTASEVVAKMSSFKYATPPCNSTCLSQNEETLKEALYNIAPVSICVDASTWQTYTSGILSAASGCQSAYTALDHCVQLVGYGVDSSSGQAFWSVRNSWNTNWGEAGYIRLLYGANTCGVADEATIVIL